MTGFNESKALQFFSYFATSVCMTYAKLLDGSALNVFLVVLLNTADIFKRCMVNITHHLIHDTISIACRMVYIMYA